jgi:hypothetical protein
MTVIEPFSLRSHDLSELYLSPGEDDLQELYLPPHENEKYLDLINWSEWSDLV